MEDKKELAQKLYNAVLEKTEAVLTEPQQIKFLFACQKAISENPNLGFSDLIAATRIYLNYILDSPHLAL